MKCVTYRRHLFLFHTSLASFSLKIWRRGSTNFSLFFFRDNVYLLLYIFPLFFFRIWRSLKRSQFSPDVEVEVLQQAALQLTRTVTPPCGNLQLQFVYDDVTFTARPPVSHFRPFLEFPVGALFQYFSSETLLQVVNH